jgi:tRNA pseudouridine55 synthase
MRDRTADGLLLVDKPAGLTSHDVVERARRALGVRRVGHSGTLDPFATGLLVLLVNRATRLLPFLPSEPKIYQATVRFGMRTTTDDLNGEPIAESTPPEQAIVERAIRTLTGHLLQRPPAYSAKSVGGVRAYAAARRGEPLALEPVGVTVYEWRVLRRADRDLDVEIHCSAGTYVRALARDLGEASGSAAHLAALRRVRSGPFMIGDAVPLESVDRGDLTLLPAASAVAQLPKQEVNDLEAKRVAHGQSVAAQIEGETVALSHDGELLAVAKRDGDNFRPKVVMRDA